MVGADGLEQLGDVAQRDRVAFLGATVLARVGWVRDAGGDAGRAGVLMQATRNSSRHRRSLALADASPASGGPGRCAAAHRGQEGATCARRSRTPFLERRERNAQHSRPRSPNGATPAARRPAGRSSGRDRQTADRPTPLGHDNVSSLVLVAQVRHALLQLALRGIERVAQHHVDVLVPRTVGALHVHDHVLAGSASWTLTLNTLPW